MENKTANIIIVLGTIAFVVLGTMMYIEIRKTEQLAEHNPCAACAMLTDYMCINKTDVPYYFESLREYEDLTYHFNGSSQFNRPWIEENWSDE